MRQLRDQIDALDSALIELLGCRAGYIDRACQLKPGEGLPARIPERVEAVVSNVRGRATGAGIDPDLIERMWRILIDWSIAREERVIGGD